MVVIEIERVGKLRPWQMISFAAVLIGNSLKSGLTTEDLTRVSLGTSIRTQLPLLR